MEIPVDKICPACKKYKQAENSWRAGPYGEQICKACAGKIDKLALDKEAPPPNRWKVLPKECPFCERNMAEYGRKHWVLNLDGLMCRCCACNPHRPAEGEIRVDRRGKYFTVKEGVAVFAYGEGPLPLWSEPGMSSGQIEQEDKMWERVIENEGLLWSTVRHCAALNWLPNSEVGEAVADAAMPALMRAAVEFDESRAQFSTFAVTLMRRAVSRWSKSRLTRITHEVTVEEMQDPGEDSFSREEDIQFARKQLESVWSLLTKTDANVMYKKFVEGRTYEAIGVEYGVLPQSIYLRVKRIRERCLQQLNTAE